MDEVNDLVTKICSPSIALDDRKHAEDRLLQLLSDLNTWKYYCSQLSQADDTNIFFISVGLQRLIWKNYRVINNEDKLYLIQTILQVLVHNYSHSDSNNDCNSVSNCNSGGNSNKLQAFTQSKLEQLLVTVCCTSVTIEPITSLLVEPSSPTAIVGVCCIRTLLELVLSDEPKLLYEQKEELTLLIKNILVPLINLIGNNCSYILNNYTNNNHTISNSDSHGDSNDMKERFLLMIRSLEALQLIIVKLPIGNHITSDVIQLLFTISELACNSDSHSNSSEVYEQVSLLSIDILTEIMGKRYLPFNDNSNGDNGMKILLEIMVKVISLLKNYRSCGNIDDSVIVLSLMEFLSVFSESHLEKCVALANNHSNDSNNNSEVWKESISVFFEELVAMTVSTMEPAVLQKILAVWQSALTLVLVKETILTQCSIALPIVSHLIQCCLVQTNPNLRESIEELIDDLQIDPLSDPHLKEVVVHLSTTSKDNNSSGGNESCGGDSNQEVLGAEESSNLGTAILSAVNNLMSDLIVSMEVSSWLHSAVSQLVIQNVSMLSNSTPNGSQELVSSLQQASANGNKSSNTLTRGGAALDLSFLVRILSMTSPDKFQLVSQLIGLSIQMIESRMHSFGQEFLVLEVVCCQVSGQLLRSIPIDYNSNSVQVNSQMQALLPMILQGVELVCDTRITPSPYPVITATAVLLNQAMGYYLELLQNDMRMKEQIYNSLGKQLENDKALPIEVYALLLCAQDLVEPNNVAQSLVGRCNEVVQILESHLQYSAAATAAAAVASNESNAMNSNNNYQLQAMDKTLLASLVRVCGALNSLARNHSTSKPERRQNLITHLLPLQGIMDRMTSTVFQIILQACSLSGGRLSSGSVNGTSPATLVGPALYAARLIISLACGLLQSLGKKSFGKVASSVLGIAVEYSERIRNLFANVDPRSDNNTFAMADGVSKVSILFDGSGLLLTKQFLTLAQIIAECTPASSPSAEGLASFTHRLLVCLADGLNDSKICAELLQPMLKVGTVAIKCYWQKTPRTAVNGENHMHSITNAINSSNTNPELNGLNIQPIAVLVTQLCVGSLGATVSPQDTLTALEGLISLSEQHQLFSVVWFQSQCWGSLVTPCLRAILLRIHSMHRDTIEVLLIALARAGLSSFLGGNHNYAGNIGDAHILEEMTTDSSSKAQDFWFSMGGEVVSIAAEYNCAEVAKEMVYQVVLSHSSSTSLPGSPNSSRKFGSPTRTKPLDMKIFIEKVLQPLSVEIARVMM